VPIEQAIVPIVGRQEAVTDQLRFAILGGTLLPGEELRDTALASWLGVSVTPVRQALARLAGEGLVEIEPNQPKRVAPLDRESAIAIIDLVKALSLTAVTWALAKITEDDLVPMHEASQRFVEALERGDVDQAVAHVDRFWQLLYRAARNPALDDILESTRQKMVRVVWLYSAYELHPEFLDDHRQNLRDIEDRNAAGVIARLGKRLDAIRSAVAESVDAPWEQRG
jgi:DNA-binding GntR family transcriptional regulator